AWTPSGPSACPTEGGKDPPAAPKSRLRDPIEEPFHMKRAFSAFFGLALASAAATTVLPSQGAAEEPIRIGELNSYKAIPAFLEPYKKGWELAVDEINAAGGINGRKIEVVSRD